MLAKTLFLIILSIFLFVQFQEVNKKSDSLDILQFYNPSKEKFEELIKQKSLTIFTGIIKDLEIIQNLSYHETKKMNQENQTKLKQILDRHFIYYQVPLRFNYEINLNLEEKDSYTPINKVTSYRYLLCPLKGKLRLVLFAPSQKQNLYVNDKINKYESPIDFWDDDKKISNGESYPNFNKSKYIEIILSEDQMIYIPNGWWYTYINTQDNVLITCQSESLFSKLFLF